MLCHCRCRYDHRRHQLRRAHDRKALLHLDDRARLGLRTAVRVLRTCARGRHDNAVKHMADLCSSPIEATTSRNIRMIV